MIALLPPTWLTPQWVRDMAQNALARMETTDFAPPVWLNYPLFDGKQQSHAINFAARMIGARDSASAVETFFQRVVDGTHQLVTDHPPYRLASAIFGVHLAQVGHRQLRGRLNVRVNWHPIKQWLAETRRRDEAAMTREERARAQAVRATRARLLQRVALLAEGAAQGVEATEQAAQATVAAVETVTEMAGQAAHAAVDGLETGSNVLAALAPAVAEHAMSNPFAVAKAAVDDFAAKAADAAGHSAEAVLQLARDAAAAAAAALPAWSWDTVLGYGKIGVGGLAATAGAVATVAGGVAGSRAARVVGLGTLFAGGALAVWGWWRLPRGHA